jgi:hypothetical protein
MQICNEEEKLLTVYQNDLSANFLNFLGAQESIPRNQFRQGTAKKEIQRDRVQSYI